jgi:hypothetical protein
MKKPATYDRTPECHPYIPRRDTDSTDGKQTKLPLEFLLVSWRIDDLTDALWIGGLKAVLLFFVVEHVHRQSVYVADGQTRKDERGILISCAWERDVGVYAARRTPHAVCRKSIPLHAAHRIPASYKTPRLDLDIQAIRDAS